MSSGTYIVKRALQKIGAASAVSEPSPEALDTGFGALNSMISMWTSLGIDTGATKLSVIADELNEKEDCRAAIISNLAIKMAPDFDNGKQIVSQALASEARSELGLVKSLYRTISIPKKVVSSTLPKGQGTKKYLYDATYFEDGENLRS